jgi:hypothetical protein
MRMELADRAAVCWQKAAECERRATLASEDQFRKTYAELAGMWREMARQVEILDHEHLSLSHLVAEEIRL